MLGFNHGFSAAKRVGVFTAAVILSGLAHDIARADGNPEDGLTQRQFNDITRVESEHPEADPPAPPVSIHNLNDAEKGEMDRMHAVKVIKGKEWKRMTPQERYDRVKTLRETMTGVSLMLTVPGGDVWAVPPGEHGVNFDDILTKKLVRFWTFEETNAMPVAVNNTSGNNLRGGRRGDGPAVARVEKDEEE